MRILRIYIFNSIALSYIRIDSSYCFKLDNILSYNNFHNLYYYKHFNINDSIVWLYHTCQ